MAKKKIKKEKSFTRNMVVCFMVFFAIVVGTCVYKQSENLNELREEEAVIAQQIQEEKNKKLELESEQEYYKSDEYIEKVAREQLGLVKPGEIVFINNAD